MVSALADRLSEAFAECLHLTVRTDLWGYASNETLSKNDLWKSNFMGIRFENWLKLLSQILIIFFLL